MEIIREQLILDVPYEEKKYELERNKVKASYKSRQRITLPSWYL